MTTCGAMLSAVTVKTSVPAAKTPIAIISVARRMPATRIHAQPETREDAQHDVETGTHAEQDQELRERFEQRDEDRGPLPSAEDAERAAHRLQRADVAQDDPGQEIGERRTDQGADERQEPITHA